MTIGYLKEYKYILKTFCFLSLTEQLWQKGAHLCGNSATALQGLEIRTKI